MPSYFSQGKDPGPMPGPPQPKRIELNDEQTHAKVQEIISIIKAYKEKARSGRHGWSGPMDLLNDLHERIANDKW